MLTTWTSSKDVLMIMKLSSKVYACSIQKKSVLFRLMHHAPYLKDYKGSHNSYLIQKNMFLGQQEKHNHFLKDIIRQIRDNAHSTIQSQHTNFIVTRSS